MKNTHPQPPSPNLFKFRQGAPRNHRAVSFQSTESAACGFDFLHLHQLTLDIATILSLAPEMRLEIHFSHRSSHDFGAEMIQKKSPQNHICLFWWWSRKVGTCGNYDS